MQEPAEPTVELLPKEEEHLDKVRDILFGSQARNFSRRLERIEERMTQEVAQVREELRQRTVALENLVKDEVAGLLEGLRQEEGKRRQAVLDLGVELKNLAETFETRVVECEEHLDSSQRQLRQQWTAALAQAQSELAELQRKIDREVRCLRAEKADRGALASSLAELVSKLQA
jgi:hypothetical protein